MASLVHFSKYLRSINQFLLFQVTKERDHFPSCFQDQHNPILTLVHIRKLQANFMTDKNSQTNQQADSNDILRGKDMTAELSLLQEYEIISTFEK